jgi:hypothetical protein
MPRMSMNTFMAKSLITAPIKNVMLPMNIDHFLPNAFVIDGAMIEDTSAARYIQR